MDESNGERGSITAHGRADSQRFEHARCRQTTSPERCGTRDSKSEAEIEGEPGSAGLLVCLLGDGRTQQGGNSDKVWLLSSSFFYRDESLLYIRRLSFFGNNRLNATWVYIENVTEYLNYIRESLANFQQHRASLSTIYENIILKQQEAIQKLQLNDTKSKDLESSVTQLKNKSLLQEERLQEAMEEQNKLRKQLENSEYELQLQRNELANAHAAEKLTLVKEQQQLLLEYENLQSRFQTVEKEKCDIAKSVGQLENKLLLQEEKLQEALTEQNKMQKQAENAEREFHLQKNELASAHAEEKKLLIEEQRRLESKLENLQSQLNMLEQDKVNIRNLIAQKDALNSKLQNEIPTYKNQIDMIIARYNETRTKCEILTEKQDMQEKELRTKTEMIHNLETTLNAIKRRESSFVNDVNRLEKKLTNEMDYSKNLESKLSNVQKDLQLAQNQNDEMQKILERSKTTSEYAHIELQQQLKATALQREKEVIKATALQKEKEVIKRESTRVKVSTVSLNNSEEDKPLSQTRVLSMNRASSTKRQSQNEQEVEVPSSGKKFFKMRSLQRTYSKRREN
ncbi:PREDICTED: polyamine-modulated factor 1-binding protein 1-like isoform X2 [Wasmannia auropunctata]|nr:PREDICTED: polyamine-modulated factor 1-binding protein 1-like isoform X2 [Wasmannia auropunctata]XP_011694825.1 PREDICTED: polyamine-modulated factor 1-binding protein 1-like isoform X2 [Wasmannia auropunctata]